MLVWGNLAFASLPTGNQNAGQDLQTIASWMAHLNHFYPGLQVAPADNANLNNPAVRQQLMQDLNALEELMGRGLNLPNASLKQLACGRPECTGGGGGGKCSTCEVDKD
jgi:hypothetical protein